jgi:hypothetical protein
VITSAGRADYDVGYRQAQPGPAGLGRGPAEPVEEPVPFLLGNAGAGWLRDGRRNTRKWLGYSPDVDNGENPRLEVRIVLFTRRPFSS